MFRIEAWTFHVKKINQPTMELPHGAPESPMVFTLLVDTVLAAMSKKWWKRGKTTASDWTNVFPSVAYADDFVVLAASQKAFEHMILDLTEDVSEK